MLCIAAIPGKKIGILVTGCRCYGAKNDAKWRKNDVKLPKSKENLLQTACALILVVKFFFQYDVNNKHMFAYT